MAADRYSQYVNEDGIFEAPALVHALSDVPEEYRDMYAEHADYPGKYALIPEGRELRDWAVAEVQRVKSEATAKKAELESELAAVRSERRDNAINGALSSALIRAGVKEGLVRGAAAQMRELREFDVEPAHDGDGNTVLAKSEFGLVSVDDAVHSFLASDDGGPFRGDEHVRSAEGTFGAMITGLRR